MTEKYQIKVGSLTSGRPVDRYIFMKIQPFPRAIPEYYLNLTTTNLLSVTPLVLNWDGKQHSF